LLIFPYGLGLRRLTLSAAFCWVLQLLRSFMISLTWASVAIIGSPSSEECSRFQHLIQWAFLIVVNRPSECSAHIGWRDNPRCGF
jgi:hypothetical protein